MPEAAAAAPAAGGSTAAPVTPPSTAGTTLTSVPAGDHFSSSFKDDGLKTYISQKGFKTTEDLAMSYQNLEKLKGVPEDRLLRLPEKMEGDELKPIFQKLGTPKEAKEYGFQRDDKTDAKFMDWAENTFLSNNLTKTQAKGVLEAYNNYVSEFTKAQTEQLSNQLKQADVNLQKEWGSNYEQNLNIAKHGVRVLGLDGKTLDLMERVQGREALFKTLHKIGVSVGESEFVGGNGNPASATMTPEQAQAEIQKLKMDAKFVKKVSRGDAEATERWNSLNKAAWPGEKQIG